MALIDAPPIKIVIAGIIEIIAMGLFGEFTLFVNGLKIAGGVSISAGILFALKKAADTYTQRKNVTSMRELKNNAREFAVSIAQIGVQIINLIMLYQDSRKSGRVAKRSISEDTTSNSYQKRPSWRKSEIDGRNNFPGYTEQKSFSGTKEVKYGTKGSVRPDFYKNGFSVDIKNYNIETVQGRNNLSRNIAMQYHQRLINLPPNTKQTVLIDIRGQNVNENTLKLLYNSIMKRTQNGIEIIFKLK